MNIRSSLASVLALTCISMGVCAQSRLTLCNEDQKENVSAAFIYRHTEVLNDQWVAYGWVKIAPNECKVVAETPTGILEVFLSTISQSIHGGELYIMHYAFEGETLKENDTTASERFYCVQDESFKRTLRTIEEHQKCPSGWYKQLFNLYVHSDPDRDFKLRL